MLLITWWDSREELATKLAADGWTYRQVALDLGGYFNADAALFALIEYSAQYDATVVAIYNVNEVFE